MLLSQRVSIIAGLLMSLLASFAFASEGGAEKFVRETADSTLRIVSDGSLTEEQKEESLNKLFEKTVDVDWIAKFAMGFYWRGVDDEQKKEYVRLYRKFLMSSYVPRFKAYTNQKLELKGVFVDGEGKYLVQTEIKNPGKPDIRVDYKVRQGADSSYKIFDIIGEGVSMITTQRSDFGSILSRKGVDHLIGLLRKKVGEDA